MSIEGTLDSLQPVLCPFIHAREFKLERAAWAKRGLRALTNEASSLVPSPSLSFALSQFAPLQTGNHFTGSIPDWIGPCFPHLWVLDLACAWCCARGRLSDRRHVTLPLRLLHRQPPERHHLDGRGRARLRRAAAVQGARAAVCDGWLSLICFSDPAPG